LGKRRSLCLSVSMADLVCVLYALNDDTEESEVTERVGHGDTETPSFCWLGKRRSLCLSVSVAYLLCVLRPLRVSVPMNAIELVAGFHPEISGRENVFINGIMLGLTRREIQERFDDIVDFAELREFIDAPVKTYSSGMYMRLGFAVAIHVDPDVLLVDEVLAVGDEAFTHKCLDKFSEFRRRGKTILLVTHSLNVVERFCDEAVWLDEGAVRGE